MDDSIKRKSIKGIKWSSINTGYNALLTPVFFGLLAILLTPYEYAYLAVIMLVYRVTTPIVKFGVEEAYIQKDKITNEQASTLFYFNIIVSLFIFIILFTFSSLLEKHYGLKNLSLFINLLLPVILMEGVESVFKASLTKYFYLKESAIILIIRMSIRVLFTIILILLGLGPISIVLGLILATISSTIMFVVISYKKTNLRIKLYFNLKIIFSFLKFGYPIMGKRFFEVFSQRADEIIIATIMSPAELGIYFFGKNLIMQIRTAITKSFSVILLPLYSKINNSVKKLKSTYYLINKYSAIVAFPILVGIALTANLFVPLIFGEHWNDSVQVIQVLSISIILPIIIGNNATSFMYSLGRSLIVLNLELISTVLYIISLLFVKNVTSVLICFSLYLLINSIILQYFVNKKINSNMKFYIQNIKSILFSITIMIVSVLMIKYILLNQNDEIELIVVIIAGIATYTLSLFLIDRHSVKTILKMFFKYNKKT